MFGNRYFGTRYFGIRYWGKVGAVAVIVHYTSDDYPTYTSTHYDIRKASVTYFKTSELIGKEVLDRFRSGTGSPEGVVTAGTGTLYTDVTGGVGTTFYVKETPTGNTGWAAK